MRKFFKGQLLQVKEGELPFKRAGKMFSWDSLYSKTNVIKDIMIVSTPLIPNGKVQEIVTGVTFDLTYWGLCLDSSEGIDFAFKVKNPNPSTFFYPIFSEANLEDVKKYIEEHKDIEAYKEELESIKKQGEEIAERNLELYKIKKAQEIEDKKEYKGLVKQYSYK